MYPLAKGLEFLETGLADQEVWLQLRGLRLQHDHAMQEVRHANNAPELV